LIVSIFREVYRTKSSLLCSLLPSPVTSSHLGPNIFLSTLLSDNIGDVSPFLFVYHHRHPDKQWRSDVLLCCLSRLFPTDF
jgi:hypothetical protein